MENLSPRECGKGGLERKIQTFISVSKVIISASSPLILFSNFWFEPRLEHKMQIPPMLGTMQDLMYWDLMILHRKGQPFLEHDP